MAYYGNDEDYEDPSEPYEDDEDTLAQEQAELEAELEVEQAQAEAEQKRQLEIEERLLKNKLKQILREVGTSSRTSLKQSEKKTMKQSKSFPNLKKNRQAVELMLSANRGKNVMKLLSSSPILVYVGIGVLVLLAIIAAAVAISSIIGEPGGNSSSVYGVTGEDFYGVRMVYEDEEKATRNIIENYVDIVEKSENLVEEINSVNISGTTYNVAIELNLTIPSEDFDYSQFNEISFAVDYAIVYDVVDEIAKNTYEIDNNEAFAGTTLIECVNGIKYFGIGDTTYALTIISQTFFDENLVTFTATDAGGNSVSDTAVLLQIENEIKTKANQNLTTLLSGDYALRTEKLFVKDYILESSDSCVSNVPPEQYVALIFMPKTSGAFSKLSFVVTSANLTNFKIDVNGVELSNPEDMSIHDDYQSLLFSSGPIILNSPSFADIDTENLTALSNGVSLFDILEMENVDYSFYLESVTVDDDSYLALKRNGVVVNVSNDTPFNLVEYETSWR